MKISEFTTANPAAKFEKIGDEVAGVLVEEPSLELDKFGSGAQVLVLSVLCKDGITRRLYARSQMNEAIGEAVLNAGVDEIACGGKLSVMFVGEKPTGVGRNPMKVYQAQYRAPSPVGRAVLGAEDDAPTF